MQERGSERSARVSCRDERARVSRHRRPERRGRATSRASPGPPRRASRPSRSPRCTARSSSPLASRLGRAEEHRLDRVRCSLRRAGDDLLGGVIAAQGVDRDARSSRLCRLRSGRPERPDLAPAIRLARRADAVRLLRRAAVLAGRDARRVDPVLGAALVAAGLRGLSLRDGHERRAMVADSSERRALSRAARSRVGATASRKRRSWRDDDERAVPARERLLELLHGLEIEVVRRLVEDEEVDAARLELGEMCPRALARARASRTPGRCGRRRGRTSRAASALPPATRPDRSTNASSSVCRRAIRSPAPGRSRPGRLPGRSPARPRSSSSSPSSAGAASSCRLPFAPRTCQPLAGHDLEVDRPEAERPPLHDRAREPDDGRREPAGRPQLELQLPGLVRLLGQRVPVELPSRPDAPSSRARASRAGRLPGHDRAHRSGAARGATSSSRRRSSAACERRVRACACLVAPAGVVRPAARVLANRMGARLDLGDPTHRAVEERAVVRDDDDRARGTSRRTARATRARRRRGRSSARRGGAAPPATSRIAASEARARSPPESAVDRPLQLDLQPEARAHRAGARVEVAASECQKPLRAPGRSGRTTLVLLQHKRCHPPAASAGRGASSSRSAAATPVSRASRSRRRSPARELGLLREVGGRSPPRRIALDPTPVGLLDAGEQAQHGRLPDAVRADEADPRLPGRRRATRPRGRPVLRGTWRRRRDAHA